MEHRLDDIVFENRNKSYGAYLMRVLYEKHLVKSLIIAGSVFILGLITLLILNNIFAKPEVRMTMTTV
ncbi:MAG: energy transducer TonB, partial [Cytophagaceae bacterium]